MGLDVVGHGLEDPLQPLYKCFDDCGLWSVGTISGLSASTQWAHGKVTVKQVIAASVLNSIFNQIKGSMHAHNGCLGHTESIV